MAIITSPALVITPAFIYDAHHPLLGWDNQVAFGNVVAASEAAGYPASNLANPSTFLRWQSASTAEQLVTISDLAGETDYVGLARHNFGSAAIEVSVEGITAEPGAVWEEIFPGAVPASDTPLILRFAKDFYTDIRLRLIPDATVPRCAVLFCGALIAIKPGISPGYVPLPRAESIDMFAGRSERGEHLGAIVTGAEFKSTASVPTIDPDYFATYLKPFVRGANRGDPFFFAWSPESYPDEVAFAWLSTSAQPVVSLATGQIELSLDMAGLAL